MTNQKGLNEKEVLSSRKKYGENIIPEKQRFMVLSILIAQFKSPLVFIILIAAIVSIFLKEYTDAGLMFTVIVFNAIMSFLQEYKAQKTLLALKNILTPETNVIRDGHIKKIKVDEVVIGDTIVLNPGDKVPADGKLIKSINLLVNESILTGESEAVLKSLGNGSSKVFMGTTILSGHGLMVVEKIGRKTEMGKISESIDTIEEEETPLQKKLKKFSFNIAILIICTAIFVFFVGVFTGRDPWEMLKISIALSIAEIPEGLPIAITVILAISMKKILKKNGIVKRLLAMETLGVTSVICTDKTGTLTEGNMKVVKVDTKDKRKFLLGLCIISEQKNNIEVAIWNYLEKNKCQPDRIFNEKNVTYEETFDSDKKYKMTNAVLNNKEYSFILGAPEIIVKMCKISKLEEKRVLKKFENWAENGLRVVALISKEKGVLRAKNGFNFLGLIGVEDPIRKDVKETLKIAKSAGIETKIITGDFRKTAEYIAKKIGFKLKDKNILEGEEIENMSDEKLKEVIGDICLFTRITPIQKLRIVKALQENGEIVAMTGDGVNDAPALKKADVGIVVGSATEVAKESADLILIDSNFKTIISACEEGRKIFSNIKKVVAYILSNSFVEIIIIAGAIFMNLPVPLTVAQILWINLICDGPLDIVLGFESRRKNLEDDNPQKLRNKEILSNPMKIMIFIVSFTVGIMGLLLFSYSWGKTNNLALSQTSAFTTISTSYILYIFSFKDLSKPIYKMEKFFKNKYLLIAVLYSIMMLLVGIYEPHLSKLLGTEALPLNAWPPIIGVGIISLIWVELIKYVSHRRKG